VQKRIECNVKAALEREVHSSDGSDFLQALSAEHPEFAGFDSWDAVLQFLHDPGECGAKKDFILRLVLSGRQCRPVLCQAVLALAFWPALASLFSKRAAITNASDQDDLWQEIYYAFVETINRIDISRRTERIATKIYGDTFSRFHIAWSRRCNHYSHETSFADEDLNFFLGSAENQDITDYDNRDDVQGKIQQLRHCVQRGLISESDYTLLMGAVIYGRGLRELARSESLDYETAKKRRQRALQAVKKYLQNSENNCPRPRKTPPISLLED
jgi:hypothetical protein